MQNVFKNKKYYYLKIKLFMFSTLLHFCQVRMNKQVQTNSCFLSFAKNLYFDSSVQIK